ncbi:hypothetical protein LOK49_LG01G03841 [Camellia lanceoleosa]|uniref:Uncharacterized protein n=1 Tax=Camellia lanceoleosa TaxID=1840588 RepID=A0ACC0ISY8_9ERIC|nr:hypothetical protein LOK49_LG01G03841 [Camellia lanceoleosa]
MSYQLCLSTCTLHHSLTPTVDSHPQLQSSSLCPSGCSAEHECWPAMLDSLNFTSNFSTHVALRCRNRELKKGGEVEMVHLPFGVFISDWACVGSLDEMEGLRCSVMAVKSDYGELLEKDTVDSHLNKANKIMSDCGNDKKGPNLVSIELRIKEIQGESKHVEYGEEVEEF